MPRTNPPYPPEYRRRLVELVRSGRSPESLARQFEPSAQAIRTWVRQAARVTHLFNRLHAHGYVAKIPHTRRWRVTKLGRAAMSAALDVRENAFPAAYARAAA